MLNAYFTDSIVLVQKSFDKWGEPLADVLVTFDGRIDRKTRLVRNFAGEQVVSGAMVYVPATLTITHVDQLRFDGSDHVILSINTMTDFSETHKEVYAA
jgi:hypothetical protein